MTEATLHHVCEGAVVIYKRDGSKYSELSPSGAFPAVESLSCSFNHPETRIEGHPGTFPQGGRSFCERVADLFAGKQGGLLDPHAELPVGISGDDTAASLRLDATH
jgi:hypothetical protein